MPIHPLLQLLQLAVARGASDLHLSAGQVPMLRMDGEIVRLEAAILTHEDVLERVQAIMTAEQQRLYHERKECDFAYEVPGLSRFRVNVFQQHRGAAAVLRVIPSEVLSLQALGAPPILAQLARKRSGLVLVTGATGCGKSTTLAAMIDHLNHHAALHILTVEDPIEFVHTPDRALINQREVRRDTGSFADALQAALREDPDVLLVGELRDLPSIRLALTAAETGHLVLGTLHTRSAAKAIDRLVDVFDAAEKTLIRTMLSESLEAVISQTLCRGTAGTVGKRVAAYEVMLGSPAIRNLIRENKTAQMYATMQTARQEGMQTLDQGLADLLKMGRLSAEQARAHASSPTLFASQNL